MLGNRLRLVFLGSFLALCISILMAIWGFPFIVDSQLKKNLQIENSSMMFEKWRSLPVPLDFKVYLFNVTNAEEINKGAKPKLQEIGPYVYKEYREKEIIGYGENDTIIYMLQKSFYFDENSTLPFSEEDEITVINFSYLGALLTVQDMMPSFVGFVNGALEQLFTNLTDPFLRVRVKDLLFDGIFLNCSGDNSALPLVCGKIKADMPPTMRPALDQTDGSGFYFSMFAHMNLTASGPYEMNRGTKELDKLGSIVSYKNKTSMTNWGDQYCGMINGTDSSIFPPFRGNAPEKLYTFEPEVCRSLYASFVEKKTLHDLEAYYYEISREALAAKSANPDNKCFCKKNWSANHDGCLLMGLLNLQPCQGAPAIASLPHFYLGSEELLEYFGAGIKPDKEKHNIFVFIDHVTGVVLWGVRRLQFNIELRNIDTIPQLQYVQTGLFPLLWIDEGAKLPENIVAEIKSSHSLISYVQIVRWALLAVALLATILSGVTLARANLIPFWPKKSNSVSFVLSHGNLGNGNNKEQ